MVLVVCWVTQGARRSAVPSANRMRHNLARLVIPVQGHCPLERADRWPQTLTKGWCRAVGCAYDPLNGENLPSVCARLPDPTHGNSTSAL
jgi:hypothetical protein